MAEPTEERELPQALVVRPRRGRPSVVWIIPILAALVAIGIAVQRIRSEGPTITIVFHAAEGIEAGKTFIKYKDVNIGQVKAVQLTEDFSKVEVTAKMSKRAAGLMVEDAKFWVVRPSISLSGISGLNTLLSGNYIGFEAGTSDNEASDFVGLDKAPFVASHPGREFVLKADELGSLTIGSPVYYRRLPAGQVISYNLAADGKSVDLRIFVDAPYDAYVNASTRFWNASGFDVTVDANGVDVHTESLVALLVGGLSFDASPLAVDTARAAADTRFALYPDREAAMKAPDAGARRYVLQFNESLRGLSVGAPVTFLGLPAGEVTAVDLAYDKASARVRPRVTIIFNPDRLVAMADTKSAGNAATKPAPMDDKRRRAFLQQLVEERGLRAQLRTGSLLTGQLYVAFEYFPRAAKAKIAWNADTAELPVVDSALVDIEAKLTNVLDKLDKVPLEEIGVGLKKDLEALDRTLTDAGKLIRSVDTDLVPTLKTDLDSLHGALDKFARTLDSVDTNLLGQNAPAQQELRDALTEFTRAARSVRMLIDYLERHPESAIRGKMESAVGGK
jgi:paraquat-inducible protein B